MYNLVREKWFNVESKIKYNLEQYSYDGKKENEKNLDEFLQKVDEYIKRRPNNKKDEEIWQKEGEVIFKKYFKEDEIFNFKYLKDEEQDSIMKVTNSFIDKAKEFDEELSKEDIFQALRNVWIIVIMQIMLNEKCKLTNSIFGYSMIYPYSDNFLDDNDISDEEKSEFNKRLYSMLKGKKINNKNSMEKKIYRLIQYIEDDYSREEFSNVYNSLFEIQEGQMRSVEQYEKYFIPYKNDILGISIKKGGASVLADGYLIKGKLNSKEKKFCLFYGFALQLVDDLQDLKSDINDNHATIMSQIAGHYYLDEIVNKLINFSYDLFENEELLKEKENIKLVIESNCLMLILASIVLNKEYFSKNYIDTIDKYLPFTADYIEKLNKTMMKKVKRVESLV